MEFQGFPKIPRLSREVIITEKIDGSNAQILIIRDSIPETSIEHLVAVNEDQTLGMLVGSRSRWLVPGKNDNFGFAAWAKEHASELFQLGEGRHFGEWWGGKIQRGYGLKEKRFSLFNTSRWADRHFGELIYQPDVQVEEAVGMQWAPACCHVVPVLYQGEFHTEAVEDVIEELTREGSKAAPGFMNPEGVIIFHTAGNLMFKKTLKDDEKPKGKQDA